jgi:oligoendopeptidase F
MFGQILFRQTMFAEFEQQVHEIEENTLRDAGVDMQSPDPIEKAMHLFQKRIEQLRELLVS